MLKVMIAEDADRMVAFRALIIVEQIVPQATQRGHPEFPVPTGDGHLLSHGTSSPASVPEPAGLVILGCAQVLMLGSFCISA